MRTINLLLIIMGLFGGIGFSENMQSSINKDNLIMADDQSAIVDTFIATYDNPYESSNTQQFLPDTSFCDSSYHGRIKKATHDSNFDPAVLFQNPNVLFKGDVISYHDGGDDPVLKTITPKGEYLTADAVEFLEGHPNMPPNNEYSALENPIHQAGASEISLPERFVTRSLDRNTAVLFLYIDGGGSNQFDWTKAMKDTTYRHSNEMLQQVVDNAHSYGIDISLSMYYAYVQIASEPILCSSGISYGSIGLWDDNALDSWRNEAVGALGYTPNLRGLFDIIKYVSNRSGCSQVATIFVINSDTLKTHITGSPVNWAAEWDFNYRLSKPYCTVERRGGAISDAAFKGVAKHELFHLFGAADEYDGSSDCADQANCGLGKYGMLLAANNNCPLCAGGNQDACVMNDPINEASDVCWYTRLALGWYDPDSNGGGLVDDMPVDHTALVTRNDSLGDYFEVRTLAGYFVNAFRISDYNSYLQPNGTRTVQVLGMNYDRVKIAPGIYYGIINGGSQFAFALNLNNSHPAATITNYSSYGSYFQFTFNGVAHVNMKVLNIYTGEWWYSFTGRLLAGSNTDYYFLWKNYDWVKDGTYPNTNLGWLCDGINMPTAGGNHIIDYGPPGRWNMTKLTYDSESDLVETEFDSGSWSEDAHLYQNSTDWESLRSPFGFFSAVSWYNHIGSDYCRVYVKATNSNGVSYSDTLTYVTQPNPPCYIEFSQVNQTACQPVPVDSVPIVPDPKHPTPCEPVTQQINAIAISCIQPDLQRTENITGYRMRLGHYIEYPEGSHSYIWKKDSIYIPSDGGQVYDTIYNLDPYAHYFTNIATLDRFGGISEWGLPIYDSLYVGGYPINVADDPTQPSNEGSKLNQLSYLFAVSQNYPNPFNPQTEISFSLAKSCDVTLEVFNIAGQKVATLIDKQIDAGNHVVRWNGRDSNDLSVASGIYLYRLKAGEFADTKKMILLK